MKYLVAIIPGQHHLRRLSNFEDIKWSKVKHQDVGGCTTISAWIGVTDWVDQQHQPQYCFSTLRDNLSFAPTTVMSTIAYPNSNIPFRINAVMRYPDVVNTCACNGLLSVRDILDPDYIMSVLAPTPFTFHWLVLQTLVDG